MGERGRRMRGASMVAAVALAAVTLSGCSLIGDGQQVWNIIQQDAAQQDALKVALVELRALDGVTAVSSRFRADGPSGDEVDIDVVAKASSTTAELVTMAEIARAGFASPELASSVSKFSLTVGDASVLRTAAFHPSAAMLAGEVRYWRAAETAIGTELSVLLGGDGGSGHIREVTPAAEPGEDSAFTESFLKGGSELLALDDGWNGPTFWVLPGMTATPDLPPAEVFSLLTSIRTEFALNNPRASSEGALLWWQGEHGGLTVVYAQDELRESDWPLVIRLAQETIAAEIPGAGFVYQTQTSTDFKQYRPGSTCPNAQPR